MANPYQTLQTETSDGWLTIWFNQPDIRNALTDEMRSELMQLLTDVQHNTAVRGITLRGRGGFFCAGGDLKSFRQLATGNVSRAEVVQLSASIGELLQMVDNLPQVVIAVIEGAALAGGFGLACCADVVISERNAKFAMTETAIGLSPAQIAPYAIQKLGFATARRLMLTAARFSAVEAVGFGFVDELAEDKAMLVKIESTIIDQVLGSAPGAVADTKRLLKDLAQNNSPEQVIDIAANNFADRIATAESSEGITSFFEKREPSWARRS